MKRLKRAALVLGLLLAGQAMAGPAPTVRVERGDVVVQGAQRTVITDGKARDANISPDGRWVVWVRVDAKATDDLEADTTSLFVRDLRSGQTRRLLAPTPSDDPKADLRSFAGPVFSLDGGFVYVVATAWATSGAVHQVNVRTGAHRFVVDGNSVAVIRNGRYAGYLLVERHMYRDGPEGGAYDPTWVVRPDGKESFVVPGSDGETPEAERAVERWLAANGWTAS